VVSVTPRPLFTPGEGTPGTHWIGGWVGPRAGLDANARGKILCPCRGSYPDHPAHGQTLYCLSYRIWSIGGMILTGESRQAWRKACPNTTLSITNPAWTGLGANPGLRGEKPATNRLSYGTDLLYPLNIVRTTICSAAKQRVRRQPVCPVAELD
jgi:hypothetical protein